MHRCKFWTGTTCSCFFTITNTPLKTRIHHRIFLPFFRCEEISINWTHYKAGVSYDSSFHQAGHTENGGSCLWRKYLESLVQRLSRSRKQYNTVRCTLVKNPNKCLKRKKHLVPIRKLYFIRSMWANKHRR